MDFTDLLLGEWDFRAASFSDLRERPLEMGLVSFGARFREVDRRKRLPATEDFSIDEDRALLVRETPAFAVQRA
jgi:hypothetical protein